MANSWHYQPDAYLKRALESYKADVEDIEAELARRREAEKPPQYAVDDAVETAYGNLRRHFTLEQCLYLSEYIDAKRAAAGCGHDWCKRHGVQKEDDGE